MLNFLQTSYSSRNLAWSVVVEEQLFFVSSKFSLRATGKVSCFYCNFEVCCSLPQGLVQLDLTAALFLHYHNIPCFSEQLELQCNICESERLQCKSQQCWGLSRQWISPRWEQFLPHLSFEVHLRDFRPVNVLWDEKWLILCVIFSLFLCICLSLLTSPLLILLFSPCTILYSSSHDASLMDPHSFK